MFQCFYDCVLCSLRERARLQLPGHLDRVCGSARQPPEGFSGPWDLRPGAKAELRLCCACPVQWGSGSGGEKNVQATAWL